MKRIIEGEVRVIECDFSDWYWEYGDVSSNEGEDLVDILADEFKGKRVRVTIEEVEGRE